MPKPVNMKPSILDRCLMCPYREARKVSGQPVLYCIAYGAILDVAYDRIRPAGRCDAYFGPHLGPQTGANAVALVKSLLTNTNLVLRVLGNSKITCSSQLFESVQLRAEGTVLQQQKVYGPFAYVALMALILEGKVSVQVAFPKLLELLSAAPKVAPQSVRVPVTAEVVQEDPPLVQVLVIDLED